MWKPETHDSFMPMLLRWKWKCSWLARSPSRPLPCLICGAFFKYLDKLIKIHLENVKKKNFNRKILVRIQPLNLNQTSASISIFGKCCLLYGTVSILSWKLRWGCSLGWLFSSKYINTLNDRTKILPFEFWNNTYIGKDGCAKSDEFSEKYLGGW